MKDMFQLKRWALLGVTDDKSKYGYKIFRALEDKGYTVYGVNPKYDTIDGIKIYKTIDDVPAVVDGVNIIVNPKIALASLPAIKAKGIKNLWFQPGSFNDEVIAAAKEMDFNIEVEKCMYVELNK